ncbi:uncharacterized protein LOC142302455 [Anomaloglossus baeobatrachus]|uniref:uncharacterized protein LOC142302455 n=1 Tax=Anomaloglossus baeobatrachus TaxID=238106 RepID=UPI003F4F535B
MMISIQLRIIILTVLLTKWTVMAQLEDCRSAETADIVFLVDESWSVGEDNFQIIKDFIRSMISSFQNTDVIGKEGIRFGVAVYGDSPRMSIELSDYETIQEVLLALQSVAYKGGNTKTGEALAFLADRVFNPSISREDVPKIVLLLTDGKSGDLVEEKAQRLQDRGVTIFAIGIKDADQRELMKIASDPVEEHVIIVRDFWSLFDMLPRIARRICFSASEPPRPIKQIVESEKIIGPRDLIISEHEYNSMRVTWSPATGDVTGYQIVLNPLTSSGRINTYDQRQITLDSNKHTVLITDLKPTTEYLFTVLATYANVLGESATVIGKTTPVPPVTNFRVIEERLFGLKVAWTPPLGKLDGYKIYIPRSNRPGFTYEQILNGDVSSHTIDNLEEDKEYTVSIYAVYPEGPSQPVSAVGRTLKLLSVKSLTLHNITTGTIRAHWTSVRGATGYRLTWSSTEGFDQNVNLADSYTQYLIQGLHADTEYTVNINPIYVDIEGPVVTAKAITLASSSVQSLKASAVTISTAVISWNAVQGATGYRLAWGPTPEFIGRDRPRQLALNSTLTSFELKNLVHNTEYVISLYVLFGSTVGPGISATVRTSPLGYVSNFKVTGYTSTSISLAWSSTTGATEYKVSWNPATSDTPKSQYLAPNIRSYHLTNLQSNTRYIVNVQAVYTNTEGPPATLIQSTDSNPVQLLPIKDLHIIDTGVNTLKLSWKKTPGITHYKISWVPFDGGARNSKIVSAESSFFSIPDLKESATYNIYVSSIVGNREGSPVLLTAKTLDLPKVDIFEIKETTSDSVLLSWSGVNGASSYLLTWRLSSESDASMEQLAASYRSFRLTGLHYGKTYVFAVKPLFGEMEGPGKTITQTIYGQVKRPVPTVHGPRLTTPIEKTTTIRPVERLPPTTLSQMSKSTSAAARGTSAFVSEPICAKLKADIVFLVDESSSIGSGNFNKVKDFLYRIVSYFPKIGPQGTQIAVVRYSEEPRTEFHLGQHKERNSVLKAIRNMQYLGGNTKTGRGIGHVLKEMFQVSKGMRPESPHLMLLVTDGRSQDNVIQPSRVAHVLGIRMIAVGVGAADMDELRSIMMNRNLEDIFFVSSFDDFPTIVQELIETVCSESEKLIKMQPAESITTLSESEENPPELPEGPCTSPCTKGQKGERGEKGLPGQNTFTGLQPGGFDLFNMNTKGEKGERGLPGQDGVPGLPGRPGRTGPPGPPGLMGHKGFQGDTGPLGYPGSPGPKGDRGEPGYVLGGLDGMAGLGGIPGSPGSKGYPGSPGLPGPPGVPGFPGPQGPLGLSIKGEPGETGNQGARGKPGLKGDKGDAGEIGRAGLPGPIGLDGLPGLQGVKGEKGEAGIGFPGIPGLKGTLGEKGSMGPVGPSGRKGDQGLQGIDGVAGLRGKKGLDGEKGEKGLPGPSGQKGDQGTQGFPGAPAMGVVGPTGKKGNRGDIGPIGAVGPKGIKGDQGDKGVKGEPGYGIPGQPGLKGDNGERGNIGLSGKPGPKGEDGGKGQKGEPGTSWTMPGIRGKDGEDGMKGEPGEKGQRGTTGLPGRIGDSGQKGELGTPGKDGIDGKKGNKGDPGHPGPPGSTVTAVDKTLPVKGEKGDRGEVGSTGNLGLKGDKGDSGSPGARGPEGRPGPPGNALIESVPEKGPRGEKGSQGSPGKHGTDGKDGNHGTPGQKGERGHKGEPGDKQLQNYFVKILKQSNLKRYDCLSNGVPGKNVEMKDLEILLESYGIKLSLLKELTDHLVQNGVTDFFQHFSNSKKDRTAKKKQNLKYTGDNFGTSKHEISNETEDLHISSGLENTFTVEGGETLTQETYDGKKEQKKKKKTDPEPVGVITNVVTEEQEENAEEHAFEINLQENLALPTQISTTAAGDSPFIITQTAAQSERPHRRQDKESRKENKKKSRLEKTITEGRLRTLLPEQNNGNDQEMKSIVQSTPTPTSTATEMDILDVVKEEEEDIIHEISSDHVIMIETQTKVPLKTSGSGVLPNCALFDGSFVSTTSEQQRNTEVMPYNKELVSVALLDSQSAHGRLTAAVVSMISNLGSEQYTVTRQGKKDKKKNSQIVNISTDFIDDQEISSNYSLLERFSEQDIHRNSELESTQESLVIEDEVISSAANMLKTIILKQNAKTSGKEALGKSRTRWTVPEKQEISSEHSEEEGETITTSKKEKEGKRRSGPQGDRTQKGESGDPGDPGVPGQKGEKGYIGEKGQKGEPGVGHRGPVGQAGPPGIKGEPGEQGLSGVQGIQGIQGNPGISGSVGERGAAGLRGPPGPPGERGKRGKNGNGGSPGVTGPVGKEGIQGAPGTKGEKGEGVTGEPGPRGPRGFPGVRGENGIPGIPGPGGIMGPKGLPGVKGERGDKGLSGFKGDKGDLMNLFGTPGHKGSKGETGTSGHPGFDGDKGEKGEDGPPGEKGAKGDAGFKGSLGMFGARGPVGQKGEPGEPGLPGDAGTAGLDGRNGLKGSKGDRGLQGQKGEAGEKGGTGIQGDIGKKGDKGMLGYPGRTGEPGIIGVKGEIGIQGIPGLSGALGPSGLKGNTGEKGINGPPGVVGDKGDKGSKGSPGLSGFRGPVGHPGQIGAHGPPGATGPRGDTGVKGEKGKRGKSLPCPREDPGIPGVKGEMGEDGSEGFKGDKGDPGLSEEDVKDLVRMELIGKCGKEFQLIIKSSHPDDGYEEHDNFDEEVMTDSPKDIVAENKTQAPYWTETLSTTHSPSTSTQQVHEVYTSTEESDKELRRKRHSGNLSEGPCMQPMDEGFCSQYTLLWYFHLKADECRPFVYGGCGGNHNRFKSKEKCERRCKIKAG